MSGSDDDAIASISQLGFGGIYVVPNTSNRAARTATGELIANITACDGVQTVVSADSGTYYRVAGATDTATQHVNTSAQRRLQARGWRYVWLWSMGIVIAAYCLVALPRPGAKVMSDDEEDEA